MCIENGFDWERLRGEKSSIENSFAYFNNKYSDDDDFPILQQKKSEMFHVQSLTDVSRTPQEKRERKTKIWPSLFTIIESQREKIHLPCCWLWLDFHGFRKSQKKNERLQWLLYEITGTVIVNNPWRLFLLVSNGDVVVIDQKKPWGPEWGRWKSGRHIHILSIVSYNSSYR